MKKKTSKKNKVVTVTPNNVQEVIADVKKTLEYKATINVLGKNYEATGQTISEAISNLKPQNCKGKGILTIQRGEVKKERIIMPIATFRLFNTHGLGREVAIKNVSNLFNGI